MMRHFCPFARMPGRTTVFGMILVVEDHDVTREVLSVLLRRRGHDARAVRSGHAAINFLRILRPRLVVLDLCMPDMNGLQVLRLLRSDPAHARTPVVVFTADEDGAQRALDAGAQDYFIKGRTSWSRFLEFVDHILHPEPHQTADA